MNFVIRYKDEYGISCVTRAYGESDLVTTLKHNQINRYRCAKIKDWATTANDKDIISIKDVTVVATSDNHAVAAELHITPVHKQDTIIPSIAYSDYDMWYTDGIMYHSEANIDIRHIRLKTDRLMVGFIYSFSTYDPDEGEYCDNNYGDYMVIDKNRFPDGWTEYRIVETVSDFGKIKFLAHHPCHELEIPDDKLGGMPIVDWGHILDKKNIEEYTLKRIESIFKDYYHCTSGHNVDNCQLYGMNENIRFCAIVPHEGNDYKWLLRMCANASFDRWANSGRDKEFDTPDEIIDYLLNHRDSVYMEIIENLSYEHSELKDVVRNRN